MTMGSFELRVYTLRTKEARNFYTNQIYPRHLRSFPLFGTSSFVPSAAETKL